MEPATPLECLPNSMGETIYLSDEKALQYLSQQKAIYDSIVKNFSFEDAKKLSNQDRFEQLGEVEFMTTPFIYGEIVFECLAEILLYLQTQHHLFANTSNQAIFYDLGSGFGKPSLVAALTLP